MNRIVRIYPRPHGLFLLGFRSWFWQGFAVLEDPISERALTRSLGDGMAALVGKRGRRRLYAWAGESIPRPLLRASLVAGIEQAGMNLLIRGNRSVGRSFGLTCTQLCGFSVRKGRAQKRVESNPVVGMLASAPCRIPHDGKKTWGMRFEGDVSQMTEVNQLLERLSKRLQDEEIEHELVYWLPTGWQFSNHGDLEGSAWLGPSAYVNAKIPGDEGDSYTDGDGFHPDGNSEDGPLARFDDHIRALR